MPNPWDDVLAWLTAKSSVSRAQLRRACEAASGSPFGSTAKLSLAFDLLRLGHVERVADRHGERWAVTAATVVRSDGCAFVYGARTPRLCRQLRRAISEAGVATRLERRRPRHGPAVWRLPMDEEALRRVAAQVCLAVVPEAGLTLLRALPNAVAVMARLADDPADTQGWVLTPGVTVRQLDPATGRLKPGLAESGLVQQQRADARGRPQWAWAAGTQSMRVRHEQVRLAACATLAGGQAPAWAHDAAVNVLHVPPAWRTWLPVLVERALCTASGRLPTWNGSTWEYQHVGIDRAREAARVVGARHVTH